ncbi:MAG: glycosyltransferase family 4 protein [Actinomycetota bacterium]
MLRAIHQLLPSLAPADAIGTHVRHLQQLLRSLGLRSEIFAEDIQPEMRRFAAPAEDLIRFQPKQRLPEGETAILYHSSTGSDMIEFLVGYGGPLLVNYHNITEAGFLERWSPAAAEHMRLARRQLRRLAGRCDLAIAPSSFNRAELAREGFGRIEVVPILVDFARYDRAPHRRTLAHLRRPTGQGGARWLFVGRITPNKCQHDVIGAFAAYRRLFDPEARLWLVGGGASMAYWRSLEALGRELDIAHAVRLTGMIPFARLLAHYRAADVFVCASEHEGFCVPVLEAMYLGVPVIAFSATAVPETVGDGGLLLDDKDPVTVAMAVHRVLTDGALKASLREAGRARADHFSLPNTGRRMKETITSFMEEMSRRESAARA